MKKKAVVALLVFIIATLEFLAGKKLFNAKSPLGDNNIINPARYT